LVKIKCFWFSNLKNQDEQTKLRVTKDVLDSSIVLWMAIRYDLFNSKNAKYNLEMIRMMSSILDTLNQFSVIFRIIFF